MKTRLSRLAFAAVLFLFLGASAPPLRADAPPEAPASTRVTIHYHRYDGNYANVSMWTWDVTGARQPDQNELVPAGTSDYGVFFTFDADDYGADGVDDEIGFLIRFDRDWSKKDGIDRTWKTHMGTDIYLKGGDQAIHTSRPDTSPKVLKAFYDADDRLTLFLSADPGVDGVDAVRLADDEGRTYSVAAVERPAPTHWRVTLGERLPFQQRTIEARVGELQAATVVPRGVLSDPHTYYDADVELGAVHGAEATTFRVFNPAAKNAWVVLYDSHAGNAGRREVAMTRGKASVWSAAVEGDLHGTWYTYRFEGYRLDPTDEALDPYARLTSNRHRRGMVVDLRRTDPEGFRPIRRPKMSSPNDAVIWEIHVRDFSIAANSGIEHKGRYLGFTEEGTHHPDDPSVATGLDHIRELGVTHVQLLPIQDFDNDEENWGQYNWGYMPSHFNSPDGWFATEVYGPARITEFKQLVQTMHRNGVRVIMDVVYNHTDNSAPFNKLVPDYYYRVTEDGHFWNGSGTGNEFDSENPMARKFIVDSCAYWVKEYGVDGFRFDLMGLVDLETMVAVREAVEAIDPTVIVYGEPWTAAATGLAQPLWKDRLRGSGIGAFNDHFRDAVKGSTRGEGPGFVQMGYDVERVKQGLQGSITDWAHDPTEPINYVSAHDDNTLWDKLLISARGVTDAEREKMQALSLGLVLTAQGKAFLHAGSEMCRTKDGVENSYDAPDAINGIDWDWKVRHAKVFAFTRDLIAVRRAHPVFHLSDRGEVARRVSFPATALESAIVMDLDGRGVTGETWGLVRVVYNAGAKAQVAPLAPGQWTVAVSGFEVDPEGLATVSETVSVPGRSMVLVYQ